MAAQVLSGNGNVSYTNSTGQNVRLVINYFEVGETAGGEPVVSFPGGSITVPLGATYGKTLGYQKESGTSNLHSSMAITIPSRGMANLAGLPLEIAMANGDTFSINSSVSANIKGYNCIIIPEAG